MDRTNALNVCEEYLHQVWCMKNMKDGGVFALYGLEKHRVDLHDYLCALLKIDHVKSKKILSYLDEKIGFDFSKTPSENDLKYYADKLLNLLIGEKEKGNI